MKVLNLRGLVRRFINVPAAVVLLALISATDLFADTRSFTCVVPLTPAHVTRYDSRFGTVGDVYDNVYATIFGCGGGLSPGDVVTIIFQFPTPISITPSVTDYWGLSGWIASEDGGIGNTLYAAQSSMTLQGTNVKTVPVSQGIVTALDAPWGVAPLLWYIKGVSVGASGGDIAIDPSRDVVVTGMTLELTIPTEIAWGGGNQYILLPGTAPNGLLSVGAFRANVLEGVLVPPMIKIGSPASNIAALASETVSLLAAEGLAGTTTTALTTKLDLAVAALQASNAPAAAGQLRAFVNQVNAIVNAGTLSEDTAETLTTKALDLIRTIRPR